MNRLTEANLLSKEIGQLKKFIHALDVSDLLRENSNVTSVIKYRTEVKYSIFGSRFFGCGSHEHTIDVPTSVIPSVVKLSKELLKSKEDELSRLFTHEA